MIEQGSIKSGNINVKITDTLGNPVNPATEDTLDKLVGFNINSNITTTIVTSGSVKTITDTDGVKTLTTTINRTDPNNVSITAIWS